MAAVFEAAWWDRPLVSSLTVSLSSKLVALKPGRLSKVRAKLPVHQGKCYNYHCKTKIPRRMEMLPISLKKRKKKSCQCLMSWTLVTSSHPPNCCPATIATLFLPGRLLILFKWPFFPYVVQKIEDPLFIPRRKS